MIVWMSCCVIFTLYFASSCSISMTSSTDACAIRLPPHFLPACRRRHHCRSARERALRVARRLFSHRPGGGLPEEDSPEEDSLDVRYSAEQRALRDAAAHVVDRLGPQAMGQLDDAERAAKLDAAVASSGWREL